MIHIDENQLLKLAGAREFGLGVYYFEDDRVKDMKSTQETTTAVVRGPRRHKVQLWHPQQRVEGACDCEVSGDIDFCRHCVALGLALLERKTATKKIDKRASMRRIQGYFRQKTADELTAELMDIVGHHRIIRDELLQKAQFASERLSYGQMKKMLDDAPPVDDWWDFPQVRRYFKAFDSTVALIMESADRIEPIVLLRIAEHATKRLGEIGPLHDLGDYPEYSREMVQQLHIEALSRLNWAPSELASYLVDCGMRAAWNPFSDAPDRYTDRVGDTLLEAIVSEIHSRLGALSEHVGEGELEGEDKRKYLEQTLEWLTEAP